MVKPTPKILTQYKEKDPSDKHIRMAKWIRANGGGEIDPKDIQIVLAADGKFQRSEENQEYLRQRREQIELEKQARVERAEQRAERKAARAAADAEKAEKRAASNKSDTPPVKKAKAPAPKAPASKKATAAPANKGAAKRPTPKKSAAKTSGDFDSEDF